MNNLIWINYKYYLFTLVFLNNFPYWFIRIEKASTSISNFPRGKLFRSSGEIKIHLSKWRAGFEYEDSSFIKATPWMPNEQDKMMRGGMAKIHVCVRGNYLLTFICNILVAIPGYVNRRAAHPWDLIMRKSSNKLPHWIYRNQLKCFQNVIRIGCPKDFS